MNFASFIVLSIVFICLVFAVKKIVTNSKKACSGCCSICSRSCTHVRKKDITSNN